MADRPAILSAKVDLIADITADADDLKATDKANRPNQAPLDDVRVAYRDAMRDAKGGFGSVAAVEQTDLPSDRL